jgi:hypothetical protein
MMKKASEFDNILDECLDRVLFKGETVEQCLAGYPGYAAELEPLLRTALDAKQATEIEPRPEFRERAGYQFQAVLREMESTKSWGFFGWQPRWVTAVVAIVIVLLLAGSGTVAAANNSMPDEPLYQVKLATEAVRLRLTPSALGKAELYAKLADKRVDEIIKMADKGKVEQVERASERLNSQLIAMANLAVPQREEAVEVDVTTFGAEKPQTAVEEAPPVEEKEAPRAQLREVAPAPAPAPSVETPAPVIQVPPPAAEEAPAKSAPKATGAPEDAGPGKDDKGVKPDKQAQLKKTLSRQAVENQDALRAVLDRVPESVKPALRQAIERAGAGYEQALGNLD